MVALKGRSAFVPVRGVRRGRIYILYIYIYMYHLFFVYVAGGGGISYRVYTYVHCTHLFWGMIITQKPIPIV